MDKEFKPMEENPFSRIFILEMAVIFLLLALTYYLFGFDYRFSNRGETLISFPGVLNSWVY
jgi:hypothetical protein